MGTFESAQNGLKKSTVCKGGGGCKGFHMHCIPHPINETVVERFASKLIKFIRHMCSKAFSNQNFIEISQTVICAA